MRSFIKPLALAIATLASTTVLTLSSPGQGSGPNYECKPPGSGQTQCFNCSFATYYCTSQVSPPFQFGDCYLHPGHGCTEGTVNCGNGYECTTNNFVVTCNTYYICRKDYSP
jgi:hypothetical protein